VVIMSLKHGGVTTSQLSHCLVRRKILSIKYHTDIDNVSDFYMSKGKWRICDSCVCVTVTQDCS
jgi:hypothetical protein